MTLKPNSLSEPASWRSRAASTNESGAERYILASIRITFVLSVVDEVGPLSVAQQPSIVGDRIPLRDAVLGYAQFAEFRPEEGEVARLQQLRAPHERRARLRRLDPLGHEAAQRHEVGVREAQQRQEGGEGGDLDAGAPLEVGEELVQLDEGAVRVEAVSDVGGLGRHEGGGDGRDLGADVRLERRTDGGIVCRFGQEGLDLHVGEGRGGHGGIL